MTEKPAKRQHEKQRQEQQMAAGYEKNDGGEDQAEKSEAHR